MEVIVNHIYSNTVEYHLSELTKTNEKERDSKFSNFSHCYFLYKISLEILR